MAQVAAGVLIMYAILQEGVHGGFHYVKKDRGGEVSTAAGGTPFPNDHVRYSQRFRAQSDCYLFARDNERQVDTTRRRKKGRVYPSTDRVVEITPDFLSALDEKIDASRKHGPSRPTSLDRLVPGTPALTRGP